MKVVPLRVTPGEDLRLALDGWMRQQSEQAGCAISGIGSLSEARLRLAGHETTTSHSGGRRPSLPRISGAHHR